MENKPLSRAYNRDMSKRKALRKRQIARNVYRWNNSDYYDSLHQYSKNKIHCSCPLCSAKTRNKGRRTKSPGNYSPNINYNRQDLRTQLSMDDMEKDFFGEKKNRKRKMPYY